MSLMLQSISLTKTARAVAIVLTILVWLLLRWIEFLSGFVEVSRPRLLVAILMPILFLLFYLSRGTAGMLKAKATLERIRTRLGRRQRVSLSIIVLLTFSALGYALFLSRLHRGARMGDTPLFQQSVETTANFSGLLSNDVERGSHFKAHNSPFLLMFVPIIWVFGRNGWLLIQFLHSAVIILWVYIVSFGVSRITERPNWKWPLIAGLFLATYTQHATFYDTRFAALGLALFVGGLLLRRDRRVIALGFLISMISRETAMLTIAFSLIAIPRGLIRNRSRLCLIAVCVMWILGSVLFMRLLGGPVSLNRFNACLTVPSVSLAYIQCAAGSVAGDWPLKLAYTLRIMAFSPAVLFSPAGILAGVPDVSASWLSKNGTLYSLHWHYYMPILGVALLFGYYQIKRMAWLRANLHILLSWTVATCLWQFFTTFRLNLF